MNVKVKICGITSRSDALHAQSAGADALGLVLYEKSPRYVSLDKACEIRREIAPSTLCVALVVNADADFVTRVIDELKPDLLQFHGDESGEFCEQFAYPYLRAIRVRPGLDLRAEMAGYPSAEAFLCDAWQKDKYGGTGLRFDWALLSGLGDKPLVLAGGLDAENVATAVAQVAPCAVDVSGGVEAAPGVKDAEKVVAFICAAKGLTAC